MTLYDLFTAQIVNSDSNLLVVETQNDVRLLIGLSVCLSGI